VEKRYFFQGMKGVPICQEISQQQKEEYFDDVVLSIQENIWFYDDITLDWIENCWKMCAVEKTKNKC
jgi:hypothetical protein